MSNKTRVIDFVGFKFLLKEIYIYIYILARWDSYQATYSVNVTKKCSASLSLKSSFILSSAGGVLPTVFLIFEWGLCLFKSGVRDA